MDSSQEVFTKEEGLRLLKAGQIEDAIRVLDKVSRKTEDAQAWAFLGAAYNQIGDKMHAIHAFEESLRINETPKAYYNLGLIYESVKRTDEAVREYRMALELDSEYKLAAAAIERLHNMFASTHPEPEPVVVEPQPVEQIPEEQPAPRKHKLLHIFQRKDQQ